MGEHDYLVIMEALDAATVSRLALAASSRGSVNTSAIQTFALDEIRAIVDSLP